VIQYLHAQKGLLLLHISALWHSIMYVQITNLTVCFMYIRRLLLPGNFFFFLVVLGFELRASLARQVLYCLSHVPSPFSSHISTMAD
jgi:hypothetical protein